VSKRSFSKKNRIDSQKNGRGSRGHKRNDRAQREKQEPERTRVVGILEKTPNGFTIEPTDRRNKDKAKYKILPSGAKKDQVGQLVVAEITGLHKAGNHFNIGEVTTIGDPDDPRNISLIAIEQNEIPNKFSPEALKEADEAKPVTMKDRTDLRKIPFVTIDGEDARDFDDAVFAERAADGQGWHLIVAIADVAHYVKPGSALDQAAYERGNSTYFTDRVVPMLPEALSNELCSLKPNVERACMAVHLHIDDAGKLNKWQFVRGVMKSQARLTYEQVQEAKDGRPDAMIKPLMPMIHSLYGAYKCLNAATVKRGALDLEIPERKVILAKDGTVEAIKIREHLESHKLIEEFMITANVAAATQLNGRGCIYRVHDKPNELKLLELREFLESLEIPLVPSKDMHPRFLKEILAKVKGTPEGPIVGSAILRSMAKAIYSPENIGHFGLALGNYAHFTSPIRRYADLVVHRGLISAHKFGADGLTANEMERLEEIGEHISATELRSSNAERDVVDRFTTLFLADHVGDVFDGCISGVQSFGFFVRFNETGADCMVPFNGMPNNRTEHYNFVEKERKLVSDRTHRTFRIMDEIKVKLEEANNLTGSLRGSVYEEKAVTPSPKRPKLKKGREVEAGHRRG